MPPADYREIFKLSQDFPEFTVQDIDGKPLCTPHLGGFVNAATIDRAKYTVEAITSTNMLDRYGEVVEPDGWKLKNYRMNPIMLLEHCREMCDEGGPIGFSLAEEIRPKGLWQKLQYAPETTDVARDTWALVMAGVYRAFSPGWLPLKWETLDGKMKGEGWPPGYERNGYRFTSVEMLECSQVAIGATPNAVALSIGKAAVGLARKFGQPIPESGLAGDYGVLAQAAALLDGDGDLQTIFRNALDFNDSGVNGAAAEAAARAVAEAAAIEKQVQDQAAGTAWTNSAAVAVLIEQATCQLMLAGAEIRSLS